MSSGLAWISPPGMDVLTLLLLYVTSFFASFITAAFGLGGGLALIAVLGALLPPAALIPVHGLIQLGSNGFRALVMIRHTLWPVTISFLAGSLIGVAIGGSLVVELPGGYIQIGLGLFIIWSVLAKPPAIMRRAAGLTGALSSILTMFFGATGPFVAAYLKGLGLDRLTQVATHAVCMALQHLLKCLAFGLLGFAFEPYLGFILVMIAAGFLGTLGGRKVLFSINDDLFNRILNLILVLLALRLLWVGVSDI